MFCDEIDGLCFLAVNSSELILGFRCLSKFPKNARVVFGRYTVSDCRKSVTRECCTSVCPKSTFELFYHELALELVLVKRILIRRSLS